MLRYLKNIFFIVLYLAKLHNKGSKSKLLILFFKKCRFKRHFLKNYQPKIQANIKGATIVASDSTMYLGV